MLPLHHFYHLYLPEGYEDDALQIFRDHLALLNESRLRCHLQTFTVGVLSCDPKAFLSVQQLTPEATVVQAASGYEMHTLALLQGHLSEAPEDALFLYAHSKGASRFSNGSKDIEFATQWRRAMSRTTVERWQEMISPLAERAADVSGTMYLTPEHWKPHCAEFGEFPYFAGNFWWATTDYLKTLPPVDITSDRFFAERWLFLCSPRAHCTVKDVWPSEEIFGKILTS